MKILLGFSYYQYPVDVKMWVDQWLERLKMSLDIEIDSFCLTLNPPGPRLSWREIDLRWRSQEDELMKMYHSLYDRLKNYDVFINWNGINLHPEFIKQLSTFNVYGCFDDPESSDDLSKPVAKYYDLSLIGNIAEQKTYKSWGVKHVGFWPMGFRNDDYNPSLTVESIVGQDRTNDVALLCERVSGWRRDRILKYVNEFPDGKFYGKGWPNGFLPEDEKIKLYQNTKIGINFHNSTGPINFRTYILPANGVMQICDNKKYLDKIFKVGKEVVGFDSVDEAIELTKYYLSHDNERKIIAAAGFERAIRDYNEIAIFKGVLEKIDSTIGAEKVIKRCANSIFFSKKSGGPVRLYNMINLYLYWLRKWIGNNLFPIFIRNNQ